MLKHQSYNGCKCNADASHNEKASAPAPIVGGEPAKPPARYNARHLTARMN
jgi:hypothetical protein